jgi:hypothetical protein
MAGPLFEAKVITSASWRVCGLDIDCFVCVALLQMSGVFFQVGNLVQVISLDKLVFVLSCYLSVARMKTYCQL